MTIALVTGATRGLGLATARALAKNGSCVLLSGRRLRDAEPAAPALRQEGLDVQPLELDVTSGTSIRAAAARVAKRQRRLDILVNNAGILPEATDAGEHEFADPDLFRITYDTNVFGPVAVTEAFLSRTSSTRSFPAKTTLDLRRPVARLRRVHPHRHRRRYAGEGRGTSGGRFTVTRGAPAAA